MKKTFALVSVVIFLVTFKNFASCPSMEGLFRGGMNPDLQGEMVSLVLKVTEGKRYIAGGVAETGDASSLIPAQTTNYVQFIFSVGENRRKGLYGLYTRYPLEQQDLQRFHELKSLESNNLTKQDFQAKLFYGLTLMFALNESSVIGRVLKETSSDFRFNRELLDPQKMELYNAYKQYLATLKNDPSQKDTLESPVSAKDPQRQKEVSQLLKGSLLTQNENVKVKKEGSNYYCELLLTSANALFDQSTNFMNKLHLEAPVGTFDVNVFSYAPHTSGQYLPSKFEIVQNGVDFWQVEFLDYTLISSTRTKLEERIKLFEKSYSTSKNWKNSNGLIKALL